MRLLSAVLLLSLTAPSFADDAKPADPKPARLALRVVKVMPESHQALLFDKNRGTHVLVEVGKPIDGYMVSEIDEEEVTLVADGASVVLTTPDQTWRRGRELTIGTKPLAPYPPPVVAAPLPTVAAPVDPYADVRTTDTGTPAAIAPTPQPIATGGLRIDPAVATVSAAPTVVSATGTPAGTAPLPVDAAATPPVVSTAGTPAGAAPSAALPVDTTAPTTATVAAPTAIAPASEVAPATAAPATAAPALDVAATPAIATPAPTVSAPADPYAPPPAAELSISVGRAEFERALLDFGKLSASAKGAFTPVGLRLDKLLESSLYFKAGLRAGDVVTAVDGKPLHSIDDAADLYARASGVKGVTVQLIRDGKPVTLRVAIQ